MTPDGRLSAFKRVASAANTDIIARPDGSMWFSDPYAHRIRAIAPDGAARDIEAQVPADAEPQHMAAMPDGSVWYSDSRDDGGLGRVWPDGTVTLMFYGQARDITRIAAGPGGDLWFLTGRDPAQDGGPAIGRVTSSGEVASYRLPRGSMPADISVAPDGTVWVANSGGADFGVGRLRPDGKLTLFRGGPIEEAEHVAAAHDGRTWFTSTGNRLGWLPANACASRRRFTLTLGPIQASELARRMRRSRPGGDLRASPQFPSPGPLRGYSWTCVATCPGGS